MDTNMDIVLSEPYSIRFQPYPPPFPPISCSASPPFLSPPLSSPLRHRTLPPPSSLPSPLRHRSLPPPRYTPFRLPSLSLPVSFPFPKTLPLLGIGPFPAPWPPSPPHSPAPVPSGTVWPNRAEWGASIRPGLAEQRPLVRPIIRPYLAEQRPPVRLCLAERRASIRPGLSGRTEWPLFGQTGLNMDPRFGSVWSNGAKGGASARRGGAGSVPGSGKETGPRGTVLGGEKMRCWEGRRRGEGGVERKGGRII